MDRRRFLYNSGSLILACAIDPLELFAASEVGSWQERSRPLMGTFCSIAVYGEKKSAKDTIDSCFSFIEQQISELSYFEDASLTSRLNREKRLALADCSVNFCKLLNLSEQIEKTSAGLFNVRTAGLTKLWREAREHNFLPSNKDIRSELLRAKESSLEILSGELVLKGESEIEFGGIGKGYIADLARSYLEKRGVKFARIACSGDLAFLGDTNWTIDVVHPRKDGLLGQISTSGKRAISTSGDYVFYQEVQGERIHHLIDLTTGRPAHHLESVTILASDAGLADALATTAFMLPAEEALKFVNKFSGVEALIVDRRGEIHKTKNLNFARQV